MVTRKSWIDYSFWPILLTMKYALIVTLVLILLRIDMFVGVFERMVQKIPQFKKEEVSELSTPPSKLTKVDLKISSKEQFIVLLNEFSYNPGTQSKNLILEFIKNNPSSLEIDRNALFSAMEKWVPQIREENIELISLLKELMNSFKGEKLKLVQEFFSLYIDNNPEFFISFYPHQIDPNCMVSKLVWDFEGKIELDKIKTRQEAFDSLEGKAPQEKLDFLKNCKLVLRVEQSESEKMEKI